MPDQDDRSWLAQHSAWRTPEPSQDRGPRPDADVSRVAAARMTSPRPGRSSASTSGPDRAPRPVLRDRRVREPQTASVSSTDATVTEVARYLTDFDPKNPRWFSDHRAELPPGYERTEQNAPPGYFGRNQAATAEAARATGRPGSAGDLPGADQGTRPGPESSATRPSERSQTGPAPSTGRGPGHGGHTSG